MLCPKNLAAMLGALALVVPTLAEAKPPKHPQHKEAVVHPAKKPHAKGATKLASHDAHGKKRARLEPIVKRERSGKKAESIGFPNEGRLEGGIKLDTSVAYVRVVPAYAKSEARYGLPELVHGIEKAAKAVQKKFPDAVLNVGDISRKNGGEIDRHNSHESGRDADIGFYVTDAKGKAVHAKTFVRFDEALSATNYPGAKLDVARTWLFLEKLLADPQAHVTHVFVADHIRDRLIKHARSKGVAGALLTKAQTVLMQPSKGLPHDDHMHVRISCPKAKSDPGEQCHEYSKGALVDGGRAQIGADGKVHAVKAPKKGARVVPVIRTPRKEHHAAKPAALPAPAKRRGVVVAKEAPAKEAKLAPFVKQLLDGGSDEAAADGAEVRDAVDEEGLVRITN